MQTQDIASQLQQARATGVALDYRRLQVADRAQAYAVQDAILAGLGPIGGWKVGQPSQAHEPHCAPLPASGIFASGALFAQHQWPLGGIEVELALRLGKDLLSADDLSAPGWLHACFVSVMPAIEIVETRLAPFPCPDRHVALADLQSHGAIVLGPEIPVSAIEAVDFSTLQASLELGAAVVAHTVGGNPMADLATAIAWLARHAAQRQQSLRKGQVIMTGSCTGMHFVTAPTAVRGQLAGIGAVECAFVEKVQKTS